MEKKLAFLAALLLGALISACNGGTPVSGDPDSLRATQTALAAGVSVELATQVALQTEVVYLRTQVQQRTPEIIQAATSTPVPPTATPTPLPTATETSIPPTATQTATRLQCNIARFVADVSIPDGTVLAPGDRFSKTWRLQNLGSCPWTTDYALVFFEGEAMSGPAGLALPGTVLPGQVIDLSVDLAAPRGAGSYRGYWKLRDAGGASFGL
ncbi:MAG: hypothetical protein EHM21_10980, partial [Chloroflexi bacterium]